MNATKDMASFFAGEPPGQRTNAIRWLQKRVMRQALQLPRDFRDILEWENFPRQDPGGIARRDRNTRVSSTPA